MSEKVIEVEADSLEVASELLKSQIPEGLHLLSGRIISDGKPIIKTKQTIEVEAESLEKAREQINSQIQEGFQLLSEKIISDGIPKAVQAVADTTEAAFAKAIDQIPKNAYVIEKKELTAPKQTVVTIEWHLMSKARCQAQK